MAQEAAFSTQYREWTKAILPVGISEEVLCLCQFESDSPSFYMSLTFLPPSFLTPPWWVSAITATACSYNLGSDRER